MRWNPSKLMGWGRVLVSETQTARPERKDALAATLVDQPGPGVGALRSYGDAALNAGGHSIQTTRLDRFISFDEDTGISEAEAGVTISDMLRTFAPKGWMPAVMPGTGFATLAGCIANDVHGKNHHGVGTFGQYLLSIDLLDAAGKTKKLSPSKNKNLFRATIGGLGQTGIIAAAKIQLAPCSSQLIQVDERRAPDLMKFMDMLKQSKATYSVGWIDATATGDNLGRGILEEAELTKSTMAPTLRKARKVPFNAPNFALSPFTVRLFNNRYFHRVPSAGRGVLRSLEDFFFPLDKIHDWNKLYGKRGFHQFQCVLPDETASETLKNILLKISSTGLASPLAVLKRTGAGRSGHLSFPLKGYTLALDFPHSERALKLIDELNKMTAKAGGRIYFAKDSRATAEICADMYPEITDWQKVVSSTDPQAVFETDLVRRLKLRG